MKQLCKRLGFGVLAVLSLLASVSAILPSKVFAAGETYTWKDYNTITVSGGDLKGSTELKLVQGSNPQRFLSDPDPEHQKGCKLQLSLTLNSDSSATLSVPLPKPPDGTGVRPSGVVFCDDVKFKKVCTIGIINCHYVYDGPKFPGLSEGYNGQTVNIGGTRPGSDNQSEDERQKEVMVIIDSPDPNSSSPDTITIEIKDASGKTIATAAPAKEPVLGSSDPNSDLYVDPEFQPVNYSHTFKLEPGKYTVCASIVITDCRSFTKEKFKSLTLEYGDDSIERKLTVNVIAKYAGGPKDLEVGPFDVTLYLPGGRTVTQSTSTQTHKMTPAEKQANGLVTVHYELHTDTVFNGLDPATYKVCVEGVQDCKEVLKKTGAAAEVTFVVDWNAFDSNDVFERDCKDKYEVMGVKAATFLVCSVIDTGTAVVGQLDDFITSLLTVNTTDIFNNGADNSYHIAWSSFRAFALGLLVIVALVMVVSQAADLGIMDAYTIRKVLPRLLFASIFIALSWDVMEFLVNLSNDAGTGIRSLIYAPFKEMADVGGQIGGGSLFALTLISTGAALAFGWFGLLSFVVTGLLAALVAASVLVVRKIIIIMIIMVAPIAIAASVLPNTRKIYDIWKNTLVALLVVFPIIMSFIAIGRVFSVVSFHAPGSQTVNQLIAMVAYFAPYFMIMVALRMAGGVIGTLGGMVNDRSKGAFDRLSNFRGNTVKRNMSNMAQGNRFQSNNPLATKFNQATFGAATVARSNVKGKLLNPFNYATKGGRKQVGMAWADAAGQRRNLNAMAYSNTPWAKAAEHNDDMLRAQSYHNAAEALAHLGVDFGMDEQRVKRAVEQAKANGGFGRNQQIYAVRRLFATGTGFDDLRQAAETIHRVAGKNDEIAMALIGEGNAISMQPAAAGGTGRADLGITFMGHVDLQHALRTKGEITDDQIDAGYVEAALNNDAYNIVSGKPRAPKNIMPALTRELQKAVETANNPNAGFNEKGESLQAIAKERAGRLAGVIEKINSMASSAQTLAMPLVISHIQRNAADTKDLLRDVRSKAESDPIVAKGYDQQRPLR